MHTSLVIVRVEFVGDGSFKSHNVQNDVYLHQIGRLGESIHIPIPGHALPKVQEV